MDSGRTLNELFRYLFPGLLFFGLGAWLFDWKPLTEPAPLLVGAFVAGALLYPIYHEFFYVYVVTWVKERHHYRPRGVRSYRVVVQEWTKEVSDKRVSHRQAERTVGVFLALKQQGKSPLPIWVFGAIHFLYVASLEAAVAGVFMLAFGAIGAWWGSEGVARDFVMAVILLDAAVVLLYAGLRRDEYAEDVQKASLQERKCEFKAFLKSYYGVRGTCQRGQDLCCSPNEPNGA